MPHIDPSILHPIVYGWLSTHPYSTCLIRHGYRTFSQELEWPPYVIPDTTEQGIEFVYAQIGNQLQQQQQPLRKGIFDDDRDIELCSVDELDAIFQEYEDAKKSQKDESTNMLQLP